MAKRVVAEYYSFNPSTKTVTIPNRIIPRENLLLVTNTSSNTVLFNFSDPDLNIVSYTCPYSSTGTQFVLNYNTAVMSSSDSLLILEDEADAHITVAEVLRDPTEKIRTSSPQSLIDTDFEYGLQPIKWESYVNVQNIPGYYLKGGGNALAVSAITGGNQAPRSIMTVTTTVAHGLTTGDIVSVQYSNNYLADGVYAVDTVPSTTQFTYTTQGQVNGTVYNSSINIQGGAVFDSNNQTARIIHSVITSDNVTPSTITVQTTGRHGLLRGSPILVNSSTTTSINGSWTVYDVPTASSFRFQTPGIQTGTSSPVSASAVILVRPEANFVHRPSDGGVLISTGNIQEGIAAVRQTRRYFRYQSGKGVQLSTGTKLCPSFDINTISAAGNVATITTQQVPGVLSGVTVVVEGVDVNAGTTNYYNGTFTVTSAINTSKTLTYTMAGIPTDTAPGGQTPQVTVKNWNGASIRVGLFDAQNGFYFEYDGTTMFAVRRNSIKELMGTVAVTNASVTVTGTNTKFSKQLTVGEYVVIKGQSYQVTAIDSDTIMSIGPAYRGATVSGARVNVTQNIRVPQTSWNLDRMDGSGPSGYVLDPTKMQMLYIDYTWYGSGYIRYGMRSTNGDVVYCHKVVNNNLNNAAYMRSGNLPARYEVTNIGPFSRLVSGNVSALNQAVTAGTTTIVVKDAEFWPNAGQAMLTQTGNCEVISYSAKSYNATLNAWNLTGVSRGVFGGNTSAGSFAATAYDGGAAASSSQCSVTYITCDCAPAISHWGTSVIMDGGYDDDRSIVFAYAKPIQVSVAPNTSIAVLSIRLAPSVDNSVTGQFGAREIVNRMQLQTRSMGLYCNATVQILGILNPTFPTSATVPTLPGSWLTTSIVSTIGSGSLAQVIDHTGNTTIVSGGEQIFGFVTGTGGDTYDISQVRDLGTSIISGDGSVKTPGYPNGPDILTIVVRNTGATTATLSNIRISWTEAQA